MKEYIPSQVIKMLRLDIKQAALTKAEREGRVDSAERRKRGKTEFRYFKTSAIPSIAAAFGKLGRPEKCMVISIFVSKGGVGKTTSTYNLARFLALNNLNVLCIGTDFQRSLSRFFGLELDEHPYSLFDLIGNEKVTKIEDVIKPSEDLPNLFYVPESKELSFLDMFLMAKPGREQILAGKLDSIKSDFDVILIDCPPWWSQLVSNALYASDCVIGPLTPSQDSEYAFSGGLEAIERFKKAMRKEFLLQRYFINEIDSRNKVEKQIQRSIYDFYPGMFTRNDIRRATVVKEASVMNMGVLEYAISSPVAEDMYRTYTEVWGDIIAAQDLPENSRQDFGKFEPLNYTADIGV